jgi:hypothetical protein
VVATAFAVLLAAELAVRALEPRLPEPREWLLPTLDLHEQQVRELAAAGEQGGILVVGSSVVGAGVDTGTVTATIGTPSYNLWVAGGSMRAIRALADELGMPVLQPDTVVLATTSRELNDANARPGDAYSKLLESHGWRRITGRETRLQEVDRAISEVSELVEHRRDLRAPRTLLTDARNRPVPEGEDNIGFRGHRPWGDELSITSEHREQERRALEGYSVGGHETAALTDLTSRLVANGVRVIVVNMPVLDEYYLPLHPDGASDQQRYESVLERVVADSGAEYLDARAHADWSEELFADENHLNTAGARLLTDLLVDHLTGS